MDQQQSAFTEFHFRSDWPFYGLLLIPLATFAVAYSGADFQETFGAEIEDGWEILSVCVSLAGVLLRAAVGGFAKPSGNRIAIDVVRRSFHTPVALSDTLIVIGFALGTQVWWFAVIAMAMIFAVYLGVRQRAEGYRLSLLRAATARSSGVIPVDRVFDVERPSFNLNRALVCAYPSFFLIVAFTTLMEVAHDLRVGDATLTSWPSDWPYYFAALIAGYSGFALVRQPVRTDVNAAPAVSRIHASILLPEAATVALVGNGKIGQDASDEIDTHDLVIRINRAQLCGSAGWRTDILAVVGIGLINEVTHRGIPMNDLAMKGAQEVWTVGEIPSVDDEIFAFCGTRPILHVEEGLKARVAQAMRPYANKEKITPTTGAVVLSYLLENSNARITLFGFTHAGSKVHDWDAERIWMDTLCAGPRVKRAGPSGPAIHLPVASAFSLQIRRFANHVIARRF